MSTEDSTYEPHPYSQLFPLIEGVRLDELAEDIRLNGLMNPILLFQNRILDGRNRYAALQRLDGLVEPRFEVFEGTESEALARVLSANLHRRHLTEVQRAALAVEVVKIKAKQARARQLAGVKIDPPVDPQEGSSIEKGEAVVLAAQQVGVGESSVRAAVKIAKAAPDVIPAMISGAVSSLPQAQALASMTEPERKETLAAPPTERQKKLRERVRAIAAGKSVEKRMTVRPEPKAPPTDAEIETAVVALLGMVGQLTAPKAKTLRGQIVSRINKLLKELVLAEKSKGKKSGSGSGGGDRSSGPKSKPVATNRPGKAKPKILNRKQSTEPIEPISAIFAPDSQATA